jgi:hypothetical protein
MLTLAAVWARTQIDPLLGAVATGIGLGRHEVGALLAARDPSANRSLRFSTNSRRQNESSPEAINMSTAITGSCLCGHVKFEVADEFRYALICHCSRCRRATGAANKPFAGIELEKVVVVAGSDSLFKYGEDLNHDVRCANCGSFMYSVVRDGQYAHVTMGSLAQSPSIRPTAHIFVGSKAPWEVIGDGLPQHDEM